MTTWNILITLMHDELQIANLKVSVDSTEKERDFYFSKLRDIEILCQRPELEHLPVRRNSTTYVHVLHIFTGFEVLTCILGHFFFVKSHVL